MSEDQVFRVEAAADAEGQGQQYGDGTAEHATIAQGGARHVEAKTVHVDRGGVVVAEAETLQADQSMIGLAKGQTVIVNEGGAAVILAERAEMKSSIVLFAAAQEISGQAKVIVDVRTALLIGAVMGIIAGLIKALVGRRR